MAQPSEHPDIQALFQWIRDEQNGHHDVECSTPNQVRRTKHRDFVPIRQVQGYFKNENNLRLVSILNALFYPQLTPVEADEILKKCTAVFCILLEMGKGRWIGHFSQHNLGDEKLPFSSAGSEPLHFPVGDPQFFQTFCQKQWKFCAQNFESPMNNLCFEDERILPIIRKEKIASGGSAVLYRIELDPSYNDLVPRRPVYALKTYVTPDAMQYYQNEVAAFRRIRVNNSTVIGYCGSFEQRGVLNIILEYADKGSLEDYFKQTEPPKVSEDIRCFWSGIFKIIWALKCIHHTNDNGPVEEPQIFNGSHQDVKPQNILVFSNPTEQSPYQCQFKLADMGLSHFKRHVDGDSRLNFEDGQGGQLYGPPECYRAYEDFMAYVPQNVKQDVDIWSLGCVLSEVAIWIAHGYEGLKQYRVQRHDEATSLLNRQVDNYFHGGQGVLSTVILWHQKTAEELQGSNKMTEDVMKLVEEDMLVESGTRSSAQQLWRKTQAIIANARTASPTSEGTLEPRIILPLMQPPHQPPSSRAPPRPLAMISQTEFLNQQERSRSNGEPRTDLSESLQSRQGLGQDTSTASSHSERGSNPSERGASLLTGMRSSVIANPQTTLNYPGRRQVRAVLASTQQTSYGVEKDSANQSTEHADGMSTHSVARRYSFEPNSIENSTGPRNDNPNQHPNEQQTKQPVYEPLSTGNHHSQSNVEIPENFPTTLSEHAPSEQSTHPDLTRATSSQKKRPELSVVYAMDWRARHRPTTVKKFKKVFGIGSPPSSLPHLYLQKRQKLRDNIFLIDNAESMADHWPELISLTGLLAYLLKSSDPDGIEMHYTNKSSSIKSRASKALTKSLEETTPEGISNIGLDINTILGKYRRVLNTMYVPGVNFGTVIDVPKLSLYVFTDGVWEDGCDALTPVRALLKDLFRLRLGKGQVGIQFIQFGRDPVGTERLRKLNMDIKIAGSSMELNIVDTEPSNENVWKMLLGSIDPYYED